MSGREEAEEALNDSFLKVFSRLGQYNAAYSFKTWVRQITVNTCIDRLRKKRNLIPWLDLSLFLNHTPLISEELPELLSNDDQTPVLPILQKLPPRYRAVFNLYVFEEFSHKEIAAKLSISEGTSKSNYARAKAILRKHLEKKIAYTGKTPIQIILSSDEF